MVRFREVGGFLSSMGMGAMGGAVTGKLVVAGVATVALAFGVTLGAPVVAVIGLGGAAVGAYAGGSIGADVGEQAGLKIYEWFHNE